MFITTPKIMNTFIYKIQEKKTAREEQLICMCARVSVKFRSWPTNQDTRGCNLVGKNRINNRINHIIFSLFFFLFFSYFLFGLKYHTTDKVNGRNKKESVSREHKNN